MKDNTLINIFFYMTILSFSVTLLSLYVNGPTSSITIALLVGIFAILILKNIVFKRYKINREKGNNTKHFKILSNVFMLIFIITINVFFRYNKNWLIISWISALISYYISEKKELKNK